MKRISKTQQAEIQAAIDKLDLAGDELGSEIARYNSYLDGMKKAVQEKQEAYNEAARELRETYVEVAEEARSYYEDRSEKWQEGESGQRYSGWVDQLEVFDVEEIDIQFAGELERDGIMDAEQLELPPDSPDEV